MIMRKIFERPGVPMQEDAPSPGIERIRRSDGRFTLRCRFGSNIAGYDEPTKYAHKPVIEHGRKIED